MNGDGCRYDICFLHDDTFNQSLAAMPPTAMEGMGPDMMAAMPPRKTWMPI